MMRKIKNNLDGMYESYMSHKENLQSTNSEFQLNH